MAEPMEHLWKPIENNRSNWKTMNVMAIGPNVANSTRASFLHDLWITRSEPRRGNLRQNSDIEEFQPGLTVKLPAVQVPLQSGLFRAAPQHKKIVRDCASSQL